MNLPSKNNWGRSGGASLEKDSFTGVGPESASAGGTEDILEDTSAGSLPAFTSSAMPLWKENLETDSKPYEKADPIALFNEEANALEQEILSKNKGSDVYNRQLAYNLKLLRDEANLKLSNHIVKERRDKIKLGWDDAVNRFVRFDSTGNLAKDIESITMIYQGTLFSHDETGKMVPLLGENDNRETYRSAINELVENQLTRLVNRNDLQGARNLLTDKFVSRVLSDENYTSFRDKIATREKNILKGEQTEQTEGEKIVERANAYKELSKMDLPPTVMAKIMGYTDKIAEAKEIALNISELRKDPFWKNKSDDELFAALGIQTPALTKIGPGEKAVTPSGEEIASGEPTPVVVGPGMQVLQIDADGDMQVIHETSEKSFRTTLGQGQVLVEGNKIIAEGPPSVTTLGPGQKAVTSSGEEIASVASKPILVGKGMQVVQIDEDGDMQVVHETTDKPFRTTLGENQVLVDENNNIIAEGPTPKSKVEQTIENVEQAEQFIEENPNVSPEAKKAVQKAAGIELSPEKIGQNKAKERVALFEGIYGYKPATDEEKLLAFPGGGTGPKITINNQDKGSAEFIKKLSGNEAEIAGQVLKEGVDANYQLIEIEGIRENLNSDRFKPGPFAGFRIYLGQVANFFGIDSGKFSEIIGDPKTGEAFQSAVARLATEASKNTTRIRLAFEFIQRSMPELSKTKAGNLLILDVMERIAKRRRELADLIPKYKKAEGLIPLDGTIPFTEAVAELEKNDPVINDEIKAKINAELENTKKITFKDFWGSGPDTKTPSGPDFSNDSDENLAGLLKKAKERNKPEAVKAIETEIARRKKTTKKKKNQNPLEAFRSENNIEVTEGKGEGFAEVLFAGNDGKGRNIIEFRKAGNFKKQDIIDAETLHFMGGAKEDGTPYHEEFFDLKQQFINAMSFESKEFAQRKYAKAKKDGMTGTNFSNFENYVQNVFSDMELRGAIFPQLMTDPKERKDFKRRKMFTTEQKAILKQMDKIVKGKKK